VVGVEDSVWEEKIKCGRCWREGREEKRKEDRGGWWEVTQALGT
jgi:hypothetical protein